jgi:hypothetical protein
MRDYTIELEPGDTPNYQQATGGPGVGVYRLYTGSDGKSHIEELSADALKEIKLDRARMNFSVSQREPGHFSDFHPAPFRRWQVGIVGRTIIGLSDGTSHTFSPGDVRLIEDTTGKGHTTTYPDGFNIT